MSEEIKKHKLPCLKWNDIYNFLYNEYENNYKFFLEADENIFFLDTITPILFENYDFSTLIKDSNFSKNQHRFLLGGVENPYLISLYIYHYQFPLKRYSGKESFLTFIQDKPCFLRSAEKPELHRFFEKMITPPPTWITQQKKEILIPIKTFLLTLKHLGKENYIYKVPKSLQKQIIAQMLWYNVHHSKAAQQFEKIRNDLLEEWSLCQKERKKNNGCFCDRPNNDCIGDTHFVSQDFIICDPIPMLLQQLSQNLNIKF